MPVDHLLLPESEALPAIVVVRLPSGLTHFVVVWRVHGDWVQVMDPGRGRRWVRRASVPARRLHARAGRAGGGVSRLGGQRRVHRAAGAADAARSAIADGGGALIARALADPGWRPIAGAGRAVRTVDGARRGGRGGARRARPRRLVEALAAAPDGDGRRRAGRIGARDGDAGAARRRRQRAGHGARRGAAARGGRDAARRREARGAAASSCGRRSTSRACAAGATLWRLLRETGVPLAARWRPAWRWRRSARSSRRCCSARCSTPRAGVCSRVIVALLAALLVLELPLAWRPAARRARRSRSGSAICSCARSRASAIATSRAARCPTWPSARTCCTGCARCPRWRATSLRTALEIVVVAAALVWLDPRGAPLAVALAAAMLLIPLAAQPAVGGARSAHAQPRGRARALLPRRRCWGWWRCGRTARSRRWRASTRIGCASGCARRARRCARRWRPRRRRRWSASAWRPGCWSGFFARAGGARRRAPALLAVYWALSLPMLGYELALLRAAGARAAQPDAAPGRAAGRARGARTTRDPRADAASAAAAPVGRRRRRRSSCTDVRVVAAGHQILDVGALAIGAGRARRDRGRVGRGQVEPGGAAAGLAPARAGTVTVDGAPLGLGGARGAAPADGVGRSDGVSVEPIARARTSASAWRRRPPISRPRSATPISRT